MQGAKDALVQLAQQELAADSRTVVTKKKKAHGRFFVACGGKKNCKNMN